MQKVLVIFIMFCACLTQAQNFNIAERYGLFTLTFTGVEAVNNNYYFVGYGQDSINPSKVHGYLAKYSKNGKLKFFKQFDDTSGFDTFIDFGGINWIGDRFLISAHVQGTGNANKVSIIKIDTLGQMTLPIELIDTINRNSYSSKLIQTENAIFIIGGIQYQDFEIDVQIIKMTLNFEVMWRKTFGVFGKTDRSYSATQLLNGNIVVGAHRTDAQRVNGTRYQEQTWIFEIDTAGNMVRQFLEPDTRTGPAKGITQTPDGGLVYCGNYQTDWNGNAGYSHKPSISKLNSNFNKKDWDVIYNDTVGGDQSLEKIIEHRDSYIAIGTMFTEYPNDWGLIWGGALVKFDNLGNISWSKGITSSDSIDNKNYHYFYDAVIDENGNIICAGQVEQLSGPNYGWILKLDSNGCLTETNCGYPALNVQEITPTQKELTVYPNPFTSTITLQIKESIKEITLYNQIGQVVYKKENPTKELPLPQLPNGLYILQAKTEKGHKFIQKVLKY